MNRDFHEEEKVFPKSIAVIGNGQIYDDHKIFEKIKGYDLIIAADGGANHCLRLGIRPDWIVGDLDSAKQETLSYYQEVPKLKFPKDKDETDLELAIKQAMSFTEGNIALFAATGYRIDHTLVNLHILRRFPTRLFIETEVETIFILNSKIASSLYKIETIPGQIISFLPFQARVYGVTTQGLKWELKEADLDQNFLSISNVCLTSSVSITIKDGELLCFLL